MFSLFRKLGSVITNAFSRFPLTSSALVLIVIVGIMYPLSLAKKKQLARRLNTDTALIADVIQRVDKKCEITESRSWKIKIDFLNVDKFSGNEVGGLKLRYRENWEQALMPENPRTPSGTYYELVFVRDGVYVIPGEGTLLPTGKVMGRDLKIFETTTLSTLLEKNGPLNYRGIPLAAEVRLKNSVNVG